MELLDVLITVTLLSLVLTGLPFLIHTKKDASTVEGTTEHVMDRVVPAMNVLSDDTLSTAVENRIWSIFQTVCVNMHKLY